MAREDAKAVLAKMMQELVDHDWPSDETWNAACRVLGRKPIKPYRPGRAISVLKAATRKGDYEFTP